MTAIKLLAENTTVTIVPANHLPLSLWDQSERLRLRHLDTVREAAIRKAYAQANRRERRRIWRNRIIAGIVVVSAFAFPVAMFIWGTSR